MKYNYPKLQGICAKAIRENKCAGCNLLEKIDFIGKKHCKYIEEDLGIQERIKYE